MHFCRHCPLHYKQKKKGEQAQSGPGGFSLWLLVRVSVRMMLAECMGVGGWKVVVHSDGPKSGCLALFKNMRPMQPMLRIQRRKCVWGHGSSVACQTASLLRPEHRRHFAQLFEPKEGVAYLSGRVSPEHSRTDYHTIAHVGSRAVFGKSHGSTNIIQPLQ